MNEYELEEVGPLLLKLSTNSSNATTYISTELANSNQAKYSRYYLGNISLMRQEGPDSASVFAGLHKDDGCLFMFSNPVNTYVTIDTAGLTNGSVV